MNNHSTHPFFKAAILHYRKNQVFHANLVGFNALIESIHYFLDPRHKQVSPGDCKLNLLLHNCCDSEDTGFGLYNQQSSSIELEIKR